MGKNLIYKYCLIWLIIKRHIIDYTIILDHRGFQVAEHNRQFWFFWLLNQRSRQCLWKEWPHWPFAMWHTMFGSLSRIQWGQIESRDYLQMEQVMETESETQLATAFHLITEKMGFSTYILIIYYDWEVIFICFSREVKKGRNKRICDEWVNNKGWFCHVWSDVWVVKSVEQKSVASRIRTCAGFPSRFLVCRLNHSAIATQLILTCSFYLYSKMTVLLLLSLLIILIIKELFGNNNI